MKKLNFAIQIKGSPEKVWKNMLEDKTYRLWTEVFSPGSHFVGDWSRGSKILFLGPDNEGKLTGMVSRIEENQPYKFVSIEHLGFVVDGREDTTSLAAQGWAGAHENYSFNFLRNETEVRVDIDVEESHAKMFLDLWPKALEKLKEICEQAAR